MEKKYQKWVRTTLLLSLLVPAGTAAINYFIDPLWCFNHSNKYNQKQDIFNEPVQKTNYIAYRDFNYRGILMGSSRTVQIDQNSFKGISVYNYSLNGLKEKDIDGYIEYAKKRNRHPFDFIFIGLDFLQTTKQPKIPPEFERENIIESSNGIFYRLKTVLSHDVLFMSLKNLLNYKIGALAYYDRHNILYFPPLPRKIREMNIKLGLEHFKKNAKYFSYKKTAIRSTYLKHLKKIRDDNPTSKIVVFTTPMVDPLIKLMVEVGLGDDYLQWVADIVDVFGDCYHFCYPNKVTGDYINYFQDPIHFYQSLGTEIADRIYNHPIKNVTDFGMHINKDNLQERLKLLKQLLPETKRAR